MEALPAVNYTDAIPDDVQVCRCEQVVAGAIRQAIAGGALSVNDVKRRTRAGMGLCQGIFCMRAVSMMIQSGAGEAPERIIPMTARPPARVISLAALADLEN